jgi:hypothetical protein
MAGELSNRIIDNGARMAARQAYLLNSISERFSSEDTIGKMAEESAVQLDAYETYMLTDPAYDNIRNAIVPAYQQAVQSMNTPNENV